MGTNLDEILGAISKSRERLVAVVVHMNDTYLIDERPEQDFPGFARVIASVNRIRKCVQSELGEDRTLVLHSGDFLAPSRVGKDTDGKALIELLNRMGLDYCTLGNHEFDYKEGVLPKRLSEAHFLVLLANLKERKARVEHLALWPQGETPLVALTGVVSESVAKSFHNDWDCSSAAAALQEFIHATADVPFRLILTHASRAEDRGLRHLLPQETHQMVAPILRRRRVERRSKR